MFILESILTANSWSGLYRRFVFVHTSLICRCRGIVMFGAWHDVAPILTGVCVVFVR